MLYFVVEIDCEVTRDTIDAFSCGPYTTPSGYVAHASGTYNDTLVNAKGCDSILTIFLEVINIDTRVNQDGSTLISNEWADAWQWLDCLNDYAVVEGATGKTFTPESQGEYAVEITLGECKDTSDCYFVDPVGGLEADFGKAIRILHAPDHEFLVGLNHTYRMLQAEVSDIHGQIVWSATHSQTDQFQFRLEEPPGIYFLILSTGTRQAVFKIRQD